MSLSGTIYELEEKLKTMISEDAWKVYADIRFANIDYELELESKYKKKHRSLLLKRNSLQEKLTYVTQIYNIWANCDEPEGPLSSRTTLLNIGMALEHPMALRKLLAVPVKA